jgi:hypothetical protein
MLSTRTFPSVPKGRIHTENGFIVLLPFEAAARPAKDRSMDQPLAFRPSYTTEKEKADVPEHPKVFDHVGLLFDQPPDRAGLFFI